MAEFLATTGISYQLEEIRATVSNVNSAEDSRERSVARRQGPILEKPKDGSCIRCKSKVPTNPAQPYCKRCYASWRRYENKAYEEKHCHTCGNEHTATFLKPLCLDCYRKYKDVFEFAIS